MTTEPEVEVTIDQVVQVTRSKYFTAAYRVAVLIFSLFTAGATGFISWAVYETRAKADSAVETANAVAETLAVRTKDSEAFQRDITSKVVEVSGEMDTIRASQLNMAQSVGRIEGILESLQDRVGVPASWVANTTER